MTRPIGPEHEDPQDAALDAGFAALRACPPDLPNGFEQRMLAQALNAMPTPMAPAATRSRSWLARTAEQLGGWQAGAALGGAAMAGLSLGFFDPGGLVSTEVGLFDSAEIWTVQSDTAFDDPLADFEAEVGS